MGMVYYVYLPALMVAFYGKLVGKYTHGCGHFMYLPTAQNSCLEAGLVIGCFSL